MNGSLFQTVPFAEQSFMQKLLKQHPRENAVIELNNLLATRPLKDILPSEFDNIESRYRINLAKEFRLNLEEYYTVYLNYCLADKVLSPVELEELKQLKNLLHLDDKTVDKLHRMLGETIYKQSFEEAIADGRLTQEEEGFLERLENDLKLPKQISSKISEEVRKGFIENYIAGVIRDQRLSPDEERELQAIATSLNVTLILSEQTKAQLHKLKLYWALENLAIPTIQPDIMIQKSEQCYVMLPNVKWYELRSVRQSVSYTGYSTSFRVAKGFYLRSGNYRPQSTVVDQMKLIDTGTIYLTNKRIVFTATGKNSIIQLSKIINLTPYTDGVEIGKETGKSPTLVIPENADIFCIILERLLRER